MLNESIEHPQPQVLSDYVDGRLNDTDSDAIEQHVEFCDHCCDELRRLNDSGIGRLMRSADARISTIERLGGGERNSRFEASESVTRLLKSADDRYEILDEIGRGGMGVVYRARDRQLCRDVALKTLQLECANQSFQDRFVREAQIAAMLDHPGIPATHELGVFGDGRPFIAMRLVKGQTLKECLRTAQTWDAMLPIFGRLCECVAFAHAQRVIHRDIKPSNVMVGEFGEVQVMDWGLAKLVQEDVERASEESTADDETTDDEAGPTATSSTCAGAIDDTRRVAVGDEPKTPELRTSDVALPEATLPEVPIPNNESGVPVTHAGSIVGTLAYMSPEQALGQLEHVGHLSDVFSLGAVLCEILTGEPLYTGTDHRVFQMAKAADTTDATQRLNKSNADPALVDLALQCLARVPEERPKDASVVARKIDEWQNDVRKRLEAAKIAQVRSETQAKEERKRRRIQLLLICGSLVFAVTVWQFYASIRNQKVEFAAQADKRKAIDVASAKQELKLFNTALVNAINQPHLDRGTWNDVKNYLTHVADINRKHNDDELAATLETATKTYKQAFAESVTDKLFLSDLRNLSSAQRGGRPGAPDRPGTERTGGSSQHSGVVERSALIGQLGSIAFEDYGFDPDQTTPGEVAAHIEGRPSFFKAEVVRHVEVWLHYSVVGETSNTAWIRDLLAVLDPDPQRTEVRSAMIVRDREFLLEVAQRPGIARQPAEFVWSVAAFIRKSSRDLANQLMAMAQLNHMDSSVINRDLAHELRMSGDVSGSSRILMLRAATQPNPTAKANALLELCGSLRSEQRYKEAVTILRQAIQIQPDIVPEQKFARDLSQLDDADFVVSVLTSMLEEGILVTADPWIELGDAHRTKKSWADAVNAYKKGLTLQSHRNGRNVHAQAGLEYCESMMVKADVE